MISSIYPATAFTHSAGLKQGYQDISPETKNKLNEQRDNTTANKEAGATDSRDAARQAGVAVLDYQSEKQLITSQLETIDGDNSEGIEADLNLSATSVARGVYRHQRNDAISTTYQQYQSTRQLAELHQAAQAYNSQPAPLQAYGATQHQNGQAVNLIA